MTTAPQPAQKFSLGELFSLPRRRKRAGFSRRHERFPCVMLGELKVVEIGAEFDGVIVELSQGGCTFRPASLYLLDRMGEVVMVRTPDFEAAGRIRAVRSDGYGVQFFDDLDAAVIGRMVAAHGGRIADSFLARRPERPRATPPA
jgi:hypothetical protein